MNRFETREVTVYYILKGAVYQAEKPHIGPFSFSEKVKERVYTFIPSLSELGYPLGIRKRGRGNFQGWEFALWFFVRISRFLRAKE